MQTLTIDIIDNKVIKLLQDLELLQLIRLHNDAHSEESKNPIIALKGAMARQPMEEIEAQLKELRNSWE